MNIKKHVPNLITLLNLFSGCIALVFVTNLEKPDFEMAFLFVSLGIFLDFFDGFFARLFKVSSPLGLQLDSLADMVTSGLVPGFVMYLMLSKSTEILWIPYLGFIITLGSCYRLANFNIDTRQTDSFIGLPTPANALLILSLPVILQHTSSEIIENILRNQWILLLITAFSAFILNAEIPLFSLKIKTFNFAKNKLQIIFLSISILLLAVFQFLGLPLIIILYVFLSILNNKTKI